MPTQTNVIEASQSQMQDNEKDWYFSVGGEKKGPFTFKKVITHLSPVCIVLLSTFK